MAKLEQTTLDAYSELKTLFETPTSKRNEKRISEMVLIVTYLTNSLATQWKTNTETLEEHFWDRVHGNI